LPPASAQPEFLFDLPELAYPEGLNASEVLLEGAIAQGFGARTAFVTDHGPWTYSQVLSFANRMARVLIEDLGVVPGGRVLLRGVNSPRLFTLWLAVLRAGAVAVTTMPMLRAAELGVIIDKARIGLAISDDDLLPELQAAQAGRRSLRLKAFDAFERLSEAKSSLFQAIRTHRDDPCLLAFTSGTTGAPKACIHYHRDVLAMSDTFARHVLKPRADDIFVATPPIAFTFGLGGALVFPLRFGAATSFAARGGAAGLLAHIEQHRVTVLFTAPTSYRQMLLTPGADMASLRVCVSAGEALDKATSDRWFERTGLRLVDGIGATEMMHIFISASGDAIRPGSVGRIVPGFRAKILDEGGDEAPVGQAGRLAIKGPSGCRYLDDERQADYVFKGWNVTGDTFRQDEDGYFWYVGRSDDMIVSSGYNIAAPEVEAALCGHPAVLECAVVAYPDPLRGHIPKAYVVLKAPPDDEAALAGELQAFVKSVIAPYKYPRAIAFVDAIPKTPTGKVMRFKLRETGKA
jgi:2-aminobenzoate-CoA ligase